MPLPETVEKFMVTLSGDAPDPSWPEGLKAMWWEGAGDWQASHDIAEAMDGTPGNWIHAYLHRVEGDNWNAGYWYRRAARPIPQNSLKEEFQEIVAHILKS